jgi:hypothetical protein
VIDDAELGGLGHTAAAQRVRCVHALGLGDVPPAIYEWDGSYFFDKARGIGGVHVDNFKIGGQTGDPRQLPGFPEEYKPYFGPGRGGVQSMGQVPLDPSCGNRPAPQQPGAGGGRGGAETSASGIPCRVPGGVVGRSIGGVRLGMTRRNARGSHGAPATESARYMAWCFEGGGRLLAAFTGRRDAARAQLVLTDSPPFDARGVRVGTTSRVATRRLERERRLGKVRGARVVVVRERKRQLLAGVARGRVSYVAIAAPRLSRRGVVKLLRAAP